MFVGGLAALGFGIASLSHMESEDQEDKEPARNCFVLSCAGMVIMLVGYNLR